jgi:hypothetical protein
LWQGGSGTSLYYLVHYTTQKVACQAFFEKNLRFFLLTLKKQGSRFLTAKDSNDPPPRITEKAFGQKCDCVTSVRHRRIGKIHKNHYDKSRENFTVMHFNKIYDKKSYKMDIYKSPFWVYNGYPE